MKQKIICWIAVVAGAYAVKGLLLPIVAALLAIGPESVTMMSFAVGAIFTVCGIPTTANAVTEGDMCKLGKCAMVITFGIILLAG